MIDALDLALELLRGADILAVGAAVAPGTAVADMVAVVVENAQGLALILAPDPDHLVADAIHDRLAAIETVDRVVATLIGGIDRACLFVNIFKKREANIVKYMYTVVLLSFLIFLSGLTLWEEFELDFDDSFHFIMMALSRLEWQRQLPGLADGACDTLRSELDVTFSHKVVLRSLVIIPDFNFESFLGLVALIIVR